MPCPSMAYARTQAGGGRDVQTTPLTKQGGAIGSMEGRGGVKMISQSHTGALERCMVRGEVEGCPLVGPPTDLRGKAKKKKLEN